MIFFFSFLRTFYKVYSTPCFPDGLCVLLLLAPGEKDYTVGSAATNIPLSGIPETAGMVVDGVALSQRHPFGARGNEVRWQNPCPPAGMHIGNKINVS